MKPVTRQTLKQQTWRSGCDARPTFGIRCAVKAPPAGSKEGEASTDLPPLAVDVSDAVGQRVGPQQRGGALRPVHRHQRVLAHQHLAHVLGARHPDQGAAQQVGLEHVAVLLPPRRVEARTLEGGTERRREGQAEELC